MSRQDKMSDQIRSDQIILKYAMYDIYQKSHHISSHLIYNIISHHMIYHMIYHIISHIIYHIMHHTSFLSCSTHNHSSFLLQQTLIFSLDEDNFCFEMRLVSQWRFLGKDGIPPPILSSCANLFHLTQLLWMA